MQPQGEGGAAVGDGLPENIMEKNRSASTTFAASVG